MWLVLTNLKASAWRSQHDLAAAVGIEGPTLTRHLDALERQGLVRRRQDPADRRAVVVELTPAGHAAHARLLGRRDRVRPAAQERAVGRRGRRLRELLGRLEENVAPTARLKAARPGRPGRSHAGTSQMAASGGKVTSADAGWPCIGAPVRRDPETVADVRPGIEARVGVEDLGPRAGPRQRQTPVLAHDRARS